MATRPHRTRRSRGRGPRSAHGDPAHADRRCAARREGAAVATGAPGVDRDGLPTRARIVLYRRPLEARAKDPAELSELVHDVLVEQIANYPGVEPDIIEGG